MPYKERKDFKVCWTIGEVADEVGIEASAIRFWESEFGKLHYRKSRKGFRLFRKSNIEKIKKIKHLLKDRKFTIDGAIQELKSIN